MTRPVDHIRHYHAQLTDIRRDLHAHPELAFEEHRTADLVAATLEGWGIEVHRGIGGTGVVGVVHGATPAARAVGLRADMDCLPMHETAERPYRSRHAGRMHACGHDGHTAMLLGAARYLQETRHFAGTAYLIFQPAEEHGGGAAAMLRDGLLERFPADEVYALHNFPTLPAGKIAVRPGPIMAAADEIRIRVRGRGSHGAMPHLGTDPVVVAAHIITALQTIASRNVSPLDAVVVSICSVQTSQVGAHNVIPDGVEMVGTLRAFTEHTRKLAEHRTVQIATGVASSLGAVAEVEYIPGYPPTINTPREAQFAATVGERLFGSHNVVRDFDPTMGSEDFSYLLQARPGAYVILGQGGPDGGCHLHNPGYDFNDEVIPLGAGLLAALCEGALPAEARA